MRLAVALTCTALGTAFLLQTRAPTRAGVRALSASTSDNAKTFLVYYHEESSDLAAKVAAQLRSMGFAATVESQEALSTASSPWLGVVDLASRSAEEAKVRVESLVMLDPPLRRYVLASSSAVYGDDDIECFPASRPTMDDHPLRQAELEVQKAFGASAATETATEVVIVRAPETGLISLSNFDQSPLLRYYFDRVIDGWPIVTFSVEIKGLQDEVLSVVEQMSHLELACCSTHR